MDTTSATVMTYTNEGLYVQGKESGEYYLDAIKDEPKVAKDGKTYTYHLRDDAKWSNGDLSPQRISSSDSSVYSILIKPQVSLT